jgi:hypothetical protein
MADATQGIVVGSREVQREKFASHVQSIAFQLTMSRRMIDCLRVVRDYGFPHLKGEGTPEEQGNYRENRLVVQRQHSGKRSFVTDNFVGFMRSLDNRGLITWNEKPWNKKLHGERTIFLTRAGELVCALLVEADLMPSQQKQRRRR